MNDEPLPVLPSHRAWVDVAGQVLSGQFDGADESTRESLAMGLRGVDHPQCKKALARVQKPPAPKVDKKAKKLKQVEAKI